MIEDATAKQDTPSSVGQNWPLIRVILLLTLLLHLFSFYYIVEPIYTYGKLAASIKWQAAALFGTVILLLEFIFLVSTWTELRSRVEAVFKSFFHFLNHLGFINILLILVTIVLYPLMISGGSGFEFENPLLRLSLLWTIVLIAGTWMRALADGRSQLSQWIWVEILAAGFVFTGAAYLTAVYATEITDYPFTLYWSEASRYYYASLFISENVYGIKAALPVLHPSQYLMHLPPFFFPNMPLSGHRAWHTFLWTGVTLGSALAISTRFRYKYRLRRWIFAAWLFLYLLIGPVFYHLQVMVILIVLGFNAPWIKSSRWRNLISMAVLIAASMWAGISRVNWFPVPGMLAALILTFESGVQGLSNKVETYANQPTGKIRAEYRYILVLLALVGLGSMTALVTNSVYILLSGNPPSYFSTSFFSSLLWYRLLPNPTYPPGILPAALLVTIPFVILIWRRLSRRFEGVTAWRLVHSLRWYSIGVALIILFAGGLVVSTKIGGGSNLHNMDAYMMMLVLTTAYVYYDRVALDFSPAPASQDLFTIPPEKRTTWLLELSSNQLYKPYQHRLYIFSLLLVFLIPLIATLSLPMYRTAFPNQQTIDHAIDKIDEFASTALSQGGEVLLITDRQLLFIDKIVHVPLVPEYEKVFLMEMAMAQNSDYLEGFNKDLRNKRFSLIVSEPLYFEQKYGGTRFGEENNAWVQHVSEQIDCYYEAQRTLLDVNIQLLTPRPYTGECP